MRVCYDGYFSVIVPDSLEKLINGDLLKLRDAVTEFSEFLGKYGETLSEVNESFCDENDPSFWIHYHSLSFAFPDNKIMVGIKTENEDMFNDFRSGIVDGRLKIYLRGTVKVSNDDIKGIDKNIIKVTIKKVESFWAGRLHSSSPDIDRVIDVDESEKSKELLEKINTVKTIHIGDLNSSPKHYNDKEDSLILSDYIYDPKNINLGSFFDEEIVRNVFFNQYKSSSLNLNKQKD